MMFMCLLRLMSMCSGGKNDSSETFRLDDFRFVLGLNYISLFLVADTREFILLSVSPLVRDD